MDVKLNHMRNAIRRFREVMAYSPEPIWPGPTIIIIGWLVAYGIIWISAGWVHPVAIGAGSLWTLLCCAAINNQFMEAQQLYLKEFPIPRSKQTELIMGWRAWRINQNLDGSMRLASLHHSEYEWEPGVVAQVSELDTKKNKSGHSNGIYAFKNRTHLLTHLEENKDCLGTHVIGRVALWGDVIEHELGYRAECAYPYQLYAPAPLATELHNIYGCDVTIEPTSLPQIKVHP